MKKIIITAGATGLILFSILTGTRGSNNINKNDCTYKGFKLYGKVQIVNSFPDIKVQIVSSFPDLKVQRVNSFPDRCGKWQFVNSFPDFKIQYVNSFPDIKVKFVDSFPGAE
jgi:hypothetical protein